MLRTPRRHLDHAEPSRMSMAEIADRTATISDCACGCPLPTLWASLDDMSSAGKTVNVECGNCHAPTKMMILKP